MTKRIAAILMRPLIIGMLVLLTLGTYNVVDAERFYTEDEARAIYEQVMAAPVPEVDYEALIPDEKLAFDRYTQVYATVDETSVEDVSTADINCKTQTKTRKKTTWYGLTMAKYESITTFCYDGVEVLSADFEANGSVHVAWWSWVGHEFLNEHFGPHNTYHKDRAKGVFKNCVVFPRPPRDCVYWKPYIVKTQWNNGSTS